MTNLELEDIKRIADEDFSWDKLKNKTVLISGGTGFIGSLFINVFRYRNEKYNDDIKVISLSRRGGESDHTVKYVKCDITGEIDIKDKVDYVIHLASNTHPKQYSEDPIGTITTNIYGCHNLLKISNEKKARFVLASSVEIYGNGTETPMDEEYSGYINCNQARAGYNEAKRLSEALLQSYRMQYGTNAVIARFARVFGADKKADSKAMSQFMRNAIESEDIVLKSKGNQLYSYVYVADAVSGLIKVMLDGCDGEAYNVSDDNKNITLGGYAEYISSLADRKVVYNLEDNQSVSKATYALLDNRKIKNLGWNPRFDVTEGLKRTYLIYKGN